MYIEDFETKAIAFYAAYETKDLVAEYNRLADKVGDYLVDATRRVIQSMLNQRGEKV